MTNLGHMKKSYLGHLIKLILFMGITILIFPGCLSKVTSTYDTFYIPPDELNVLETKAEQGDIKAAEMVANYYKFVDYNIEKAIKYLRVITKRGDSVAQYNLAFYLLLSSNDQKSRKEGVYWLKLSADSGELYAQKYLAKLYETGDVVDRNYYTAKYWYEKSALNGDVHSVIKLADLYSEGKGCDESRIKAHALLSIAELLVEKESLLFNEVVEQKKTIALSEFEKGQAMIEVKQLREIYGINESDRNEDTLK